MSDNIERTLGRLEAKVDALLEANTEINKRLSGYSTRISGLEKWRSFLAGAYAMLVIALGAFLKFYER